MGRFPRSEDWVGDIIVERKQNSLQYVPNNMTVNFQVLDLTVNKWVKGIMMDKFNKWFAETLRKELHAGMSLEEISIKF